MSAGLSPGTNHALYYYWWLTGWHNLGGYLTSSPAAAASPDASGQGKYVDVFARGKDGALYDKATTNAGTSWQSWQNLSGQIASGTAPACVAWGVDHFDVLVTGTNRAMYYKSYTGTAWSGWQNVGGYLTSSPAAWSAGGAAIDVLVRGGDGSFWYTDNGPYGSSWIDWMHFCVG